MRARLEFAAGNPLSEAPSDCDGHVGSHLPSLVKPPSTAVICHSSFTPGHHQSHNPTDPGLGETQHPLRQGSDAAAYSQTGIRPLTMLGPLGYHTVGETKAQGVTDLSYRAGFGPQLSPLVPTTQAVL